jgi:hypothetical protein
VQCTNSTEKAQQKGFVCEEVKSKFEAKKIEFLTIIQFEQIEKDSKKMNAVRNWPLKMSQESTSLSEIDELLSKFVSNYAKIAEPYKRKDKK